MTGFAHLTTAKPIEFEQPREKYDPAWVLFFIGNTIYKGYSKNGSMTSVKLQKSIFKKNKIPLIRIECRHEEDKIFEEIEPDGSTSHVDPDVIDGYFESTIPIFNRYGIKLN